MEKEPTIEKITIIPESLAMGRLAVKSAEQLLKEYKGNDEQYIDYLKTGLNDPRD